MEERGKTVKHNEPKEDDCVQIEEDEYLPAYLFEPMLSTRAKIKYNTTTAIITIIFSCP